jgi:hypothetical protein
VDGVGSSRGWGEQTEHREIESGAVKDDRKLSVGWLLFIFSVWAIQ